MSRDQEIAERALDRVLTEARAEPAPELDWDGIESRLDAEPLLPMLESEPSWTPRPALIAAAAALLLAIGWFAAGGRPPVAVPSVPDTTPHALDGDALGANSLIEASTDAVAVEHSRHSQWTLERGGRASVTSAQGVVRVVLERGALSARVVPSPRVETFVVEAAGTRVAVHGTAFRVALNADRVDVAVTEGSVLVGSRNAPGSGLRMSKNERSSFSLSGVPLEGRPADAPVARPRADRRGVAPGRPRELPEQPSIDEVESVVSRVLELGASCFQSRTTTQDGVRVTATTTASFRALPNGRLELTNLDPPLAPAVQRCIADGIQNVATSESVHGIQIVRRMELER